MGGILMSKSHLSDWGNFSRLMRVRTSEEGAETDVKWQEWRGTLCTD